GWKMPGGWAVRRAEVEELVALLGGLRTRFQAIPVGDEGWAEYGLAPAQKPVELKVTARGDDGEKTHTIAFGMPDRQPGEQPFTRPTYARVDNRGDVLRLGPDVLSVVTRSA